MEVLQLLVELFLKPVLEVDERLAGLSGGGGRQVGEHAFEPLDHVALCGVQRATLVQETTRTIVQYNICGIYIYY